MDSLPDLTEEAEKHMQKQNEENTIKTLEHKLSELTDYVTTVIAELKEHNSQDLEHASYLMRESERHSREIKNIRDNIESLNNNMNELKRWMQSSSSGNIEAAATLAHSEIFRLARLLGRIELRVEHLENADFTRIA